MGLRWVAACLRALVYQKGERRVEIEITVPWPTWMVVIEHVGSTVKVLQPMGATVKVLVTEKEGELEC